MFLGIGLNLTGDQTATFSPANIFAAGEPGVWYDPSDLSTLFQDSAGTIPVTAAGQPVGRMLDKSGRGDYATQATSAQRPVYSIHPITGVRNFVTRSSHTAAFPWAIGGASNGITAAIVNIGFVGDVPFADFSLTGSNTQGFSEPFVFSSFSRTAASINQQWSASVYASLVSGLWPSGRQLGIGCTEETSAQTYLDQTTTRVTPVTTMQRLVASRILNQALVANVRSGLALESLGAAGTTTFTGQVIRLYGWQLEQSSVPTNLQNRLGPYNAYEAGVPSVHYLSFDGIDDGMVTPPITPNTDKAQLFSGFLKSTLNAGATVAELSPSADTNNGAVAFFADAIGGAGIYQARTRGTILVPTSFSPAPVGRAVVGFLADLNAPSQVLRLNGAVVTSGAGNTGGGNFLSYRLYIGRRAGSSSPLSGNLYSLIVRFGPNLVTNQITSTETYVNTKTGAY